MHPSAFQERRILASRCLASWLSVLALTLPIIPRTARAQASSLAHVLRQTRLDNGLDVVVVENHAVPLATVLVAVRNGAFIQEPSERGLAHMYEHVLFRAYQGDPNAFGQAAARLNASANGVTFEEVVYYYLMVPSNHVDGAIDLMAGLFQDARFASQDLKEERPVVLNELQRHASDPEERLRRQVAQALWGSSWSRKDPGGDSTTLAGISLDRLKETYSRYYVPNNAALIVTGDVSSERVFEKARGRFGDWKRGPDPFADRPIPATAARVGSAVVLLPHDVRDVTFRIAFQGPSVGRDSATYAADALFEVFDDPLAPFQQRLVTHGPLESVSGFYQPLSRTGSIEIVAKTSAERAQEALVALLNEIETLDVLEGVGDEDLAIAKKHRAVELALQRERTAELAPTLARWWSGAGLDYPLTYHARMAAQTIEDLRRFAQAYIVGKPRVIGVLGPPDVTERLGTWLSRPTARTGP